MGNGMARFVSPHRTSFVRWECRHEMGGGSPAARLSPVATCNSKKKHDFELFLIF
jgi:hypothetical protein